MTSSADQPSLESLESLLKEHFKLSSYEARAYLSLLRLGKQSPKQLSTSAEIPMPRIYDTLDSLMSKGFAMKQQDTFSSIPPKQALRGRTSQFEMQFASEQKQRRVAEAELTKLLEASGAVGQDREASEISILRGFNSIANKFGELLENSGDIILVAKRAVEAKEVFIPILFEFGKDNQGERKKRIRIIVPEAAKITMEEARQARIANTEIRKSDHILFDMMITDLDDVIIGVPDPLSEEINHAIAIWLRNSSFARSTKNSVEEIWKSAERIA